MPITLAPISRRRFLAGSIAAGAAMAFAGAAFGADDVAIDPHRVALLSDIHIAADMSLKARGICMAEHLRQACAEVLHLDKRPALAIVNGDCAYNNGEAADYASVLELLRPLREGGLPLHLAMGNHDRRDRFWHAIPADESRAKPLADRQVLAFETPRANWIMLDSLDKTNSTPGVLGEAQLHWLAKTLDERDAKPAIVMVHHNPQEAPIHGAIPYDTSPATKPVAAKKITGLTDTRALLDLLLPRKQVKALFYGHTHVWSVEQREGLHLINLPAVSYVFNASQPSGWVDASLAEQGIHLELRCLDPKHPWQGQKHDLKWR